MDGVGNVRFDGLFGRGFKKNTCRFRKSYPDVMVVQVSKPREPFRGFLLAWQARISSCARTRVRATGAVIMIFHDTSLPAAAMPRCDQGHNQSAVVTRSLSQSGDRPGAAYAWGASVALGQQAGPITMELLCTNRLQKWGSSWRFTATRGSRLMARAWPHRTHSFGPLAARKSMLRRSAVPKRPAGACQAAQAARSRRCADRDAARPAGALDTGLAQYPRRYWQGWRGLQVAGGRLG
jgi:hypothetical protein